MKRMNKTTQLLIHALALISPPTCPGCLKPSNSSGLAIICPTCKPSLKPRSRCIKCGRLFSISIYRALIHCRSCKQEDFYFNQLVSMATYEGVWKEIIIKVKTSPEYFLNLQLAHMLSNKIVANHLLQSSHLIVPVPARSRRKIHPIFNIAKQTARLVQRPFVLPLRFTRKTKEQHLLKRKKRLMNMKQSMVANSGIVKNKKIIVIDDVFTTGATINECSRALIKAGASVVYGLTLGRGKTRFDS